MQYIYLYICVVLLRSTSWGIYLKMSFLAVRSRAHEGTGVCGCLGGLITVTVLCSQSCCCKSWCGACACVCVVCGVCVYFVLVDFARLFTDSTGLLQRRTGLNSHLAALKLLPMQWLPRVPTPNQTHRISDHVSMVRWSFPALLIGRHFGGLPRFCKLPNLSTCHCR